MRAKEYAAQYIGNPTNAELVKIAKCFVLESKTIAEQREVKTNAGLKSIIMELDKKWQAFAKEVGGGIIRPDGFTNLLKDKFSDIYYELMEEKRIK